MSTIKTLTILLGASASDAIHLRDSAALAIKMPAAFDGDGLAIQGVLKRPTDVPAAGEYANVYDDGGAQLIIAVAAGRLIYLDTFGPLIRALEWIRLVAVTGSTPENQLADRSIELVVSD